MIHTQFPPCPPCVLSGPCAWLNLSPRHSICFPTVYINCERTTKLSTFILAKLPAGRPPRRTTDAPEVSESRRLTLVHQYTQLHSQRLTAELFRSHASYIIRLTYLVGPVVMVMLMAATTIDDDDDDGDNYY